jgi:hypothetical protein
MTKWLGVVALVGCAVVGRSAALWGQQPSDARGRNEGLTRAQIARVAQIRTPVFEDTKKVHNDRLNQLFRMYVQRQGGQVTAESVRRFNAMLKAQGLTNFDDFLAVETTPLRSVKDPVSGDIIPVLGPLGSDVINPWLGALEVVEGQPLERQPIYQLATNALREHLDFALIGIRDPNLSLSLLPPGLRKNGEWAYRHLNPTNKFDGGFDHPLFYATIRAAAKKLFRQDYPKAKLTMADVVTPEAKGGFGIRSCLLCHDQNHSGVYKRLLGQGLYLEAKAAELPAGSEEAQKTKANGSMFRRAAQYVLDAFPEKIDAEAVRKSLAVVSPNDLARLKPGYGDFYATLKQMGCITCHSIDNTVPSATNPAMHSAFLLHPNAYYKEEDIKALLSVIDLGQLSDSKLLLKASGKIPHTGAQQVQLDAAQTEQLRAALTRWLYSFRTAQK